MEWNYQLLIDNDIAWIFQNGAKDFNSLNEFQKPRWIHMTYSFFKVFENIYLHNLDKSIESSVWENNYKIFITYFNTSGFQLYWNERKGTFDPRFVSFLEIKHNSPMKSGQSIIEDINTD
jgi:hypothetical protein